MKTILGISLALVMLIGSVPLGFSDPLLVQLEQGIEIDQLQCDNNSHVLVLRTNGNYACVSERTAEKMGWEIINQPPSEIPAQGNYTSTQLKDISEEEYRAFLKNTMKMSDEEVEDAIQNYEIGNKTENSQIPEDKDDVNIQNNQIEYFEIWNPIREDNRDKIAELFAKSANDSVIRLDEKSKYITEIGSIFINSEPSLGIYSGAINYYLNYTIYDANERKEFVYAFMEKASLDHSNTELIVGGTNNYSNYHFKTDRNFIDFKFTNAPFYGVKIKLLSWSNNPNPMSYDLSEKEALKKAIEFGKNKELYQNELREGCNLNLYDDQENTLKRALWGNPYYLIRVGACDPSGIGLELYVLSVYIDGTTGEPILFKFVGLE